MCHEDTPRSWLLRKECQLKYDLQLVTISFTAVAAADRLPRAACMESAMMRQRWSVWEAEMIHQGCCYFTNWDTFNLSEPCWSRCFLKLNFFSSLLDLNLTHTICKAAERTELFMTSSVAVVHASDAEEGGGRERGALHSPQCIGMGRQLDRAWCPISVSWSPPQPVVHPDEWVWRDVWSQPWVRECWTCCSKRELQSK